MNDSIDKLYKEFQKEIEKNDKIVKEEMNKKSRLEMLEDYDNFVKENKCKIKEEKNDRKKSSK